MRRFDATFASIGSVVTIPEQDNEETLTYLQALAIHGDDQRVGVFFSGWRQSDPQRTDGVLALIEGDQLVTAISEPLAVHASSGQLVLGYGGGRFLGCTVVPPTCRLFDATNGARIGAPITFYAPAAEPPQGVLWHHDRFWIAASGWQVTGIQRILGWVDAHGGQGHQG